MDSESTIISLSKDRHAMLWNTHKFEPIQTVTDLVFTDSSYLVGAIDVAQSKVFGLFSKMRVLKLKGNLLEQDTASAKVAHESEPDY